MKLEKRHVVITGAAGGLGRHVLEALLAQGATCHLPLRDSKGAPSGERVNAVTGIDLTDETQVERFYGELPPLWASVQVAGGFLARPALETRLADLDGQLRLNAGTAFLCCREAVRNMRSKASGQGGRIVNTSSRAALVPSGGSLAYAMSKAAVNMLTQALAEELRAEGIVVTAVAPSIIDTPANRNAMPKADFSRWPKPAEIASTIAWLASPENVLASGAIVPVFGRA
jgi:NAD(P)-dependent dehydrogenase (short-subunit alcohol dehydrogenase family)